MPLPSCVTSIRLFQVEVENFVLRVAAEFSSRKEQLVFLINNYDMMLGVLMVTDTPSFLFLYPENQGCPTTIVAPRGQSLSWSRSVIYSGVWHSVWVCTVNVGARRYPQVRGCCFLDLRFLLVFSQERAADDSKEVESFQQLLNARTQVVVWEKGRDKFVCCFQFSAHVHVYIGTPGTQNWNYDLVYMLLLLVYFIFFYIFKII